MTAFDIGPLRYWHHGAITLAGTTPAGIPASATGQRFAVRGYDKLQLQVADLEWETGERSVETLEYVSGPTQMRRLESAGRLTVTQRDTGLGVDLRLMTVIPSELRRWTTAPRLCDTQRLDEATGLDTLKVLKQAGAQRVAARHELLGDSSGSKNFLHATGSGPLSKVLPLVAHALTRILPLQHMVFDDGKCQLGSQYVVPDGAKDDKKGRLYVALLRRGAATDPAPFNEGCCPDRNGKCVYVGATGKPREYRFREHLVGYKASRWARDYGIRLMPELWQGTPTGFSSDEYHRYERELALELATKGYCVRGGH